MEVNRTAGTVTSFAEREEMNLATFNLVNDLVLGRRDVAGARKWHTEVARDVAMSRRNPYAERLLFLQEIGNADR